MTLKPAECEKCGTSMTGMLCPRCGKCHEPYCPEKEKLKNQNHRNTPIRVAYLAEEMGVSEKEVRAALEKAGIKLKSPSSSLTNEQANIVREALGFPPSTPQSPDVINDFKETNVPEQQIIEQAFEETIKNLFTVFFGSYTIAKGDSTGEQQAEANFSNGILHARHIRDRALAIIP